MEAIGAKRRSMTRIMARRMKVTVFLACRSKSLASRPQLHDPCESSFNDPTFGQHDEAMEIGTFDDFQLPSASFGDGGRHLWPLISPIGVDALDEWEAPACLTQNAIAPSRPWISAECTTTLSRRPSVSTRVWRLRPLTFLPASNLDGSIEAPLLKHPWRSGHR
jgi:hypothetical protein